MTLSSLPLPPRLDRWPVAMQHAMRLRGTLVKCGPGMRGVGWPETSTVRLYALASVLEEDGIAAHMTAAWVWGAARSPGSQLHLATARHRRRIPPARGVTMHEYRLNDGDTVRLGDFEVTSPLRTALDLLRDYEDPSLEQRVAWRLLCTLVPGHTDTIRSELKKRHRSRTKIALARLDSH